LECLALEDVGKLYGHSVYFTAISYILRPFGIFCGHFGIFFPFWYAVKNKNLANLLHSIPLQLFFFFNIERFQIRSFAKGGKMNSDRCGRKSVARIFSKLPF
jgi:hypothetical protein